MDPRVGQRIIRDRWGEPIAPLPPKPERQKPTQWHLRMYDWIWHKLAWHPRHEKEKSGPDA